MGFSAAAKSIAKKTAKKTADVTAKGIKTGVHIAERKPYQFPDSIRAIDKALFKEVGFDKRLFGRELRKSSFGLFVGGAAVVGAGQGLAQVDRENMGTKDPNVYRATPVIPEYIDNGEATGDLVFALHDLRRG